MDLGFDYKLVLGISAIVIGVFCYAPYIRSILKGKTRPHVFSWVIWGLLTGIGFLAQLAGGGGAGAWVTGFTAVLSFVVVFLALRQGEKNITRSDVFIFTGGLLAIPVWIMTKDPLGAVIIVTLIDAMGFYPTFRKSWHKPHEELALAYFFSGLKFAVSLPALEHHSAVTILYPASLVFMNWMFIAMLFWRRRVLS